MNRASSSDKKSFAIVGAGIGGVALAAKLAKAGHKVTVLEKNSFSGGRLSIINQDGYRFDQGPSLYLMPEVFANTFQELGVQLSDYIDLKKCDTNYVIHFEDGERLRLTTDLTQLKQEIEKFEQGSFGGLLSFIREGKHHYDESMSMVLTRNYEYWWDLFNLQNLWIALGLHIVESLWTRVGKHFKSDRLKRAFTFQSMYMGMSPYEAPGVYNLLQYTELAEGIYYPIGGFHKVVEALETIAKSHGAVFKYNSPVVQIKTDEQEGLATGIELEDGTVMDADVVVCNADLITSYNRLLPQTIYAKQLGKMEHTCSTFSFYWGMNRKAPGLQAHNVFLADDYRASFDDIFKSHDLPLTPSFYVHVPTRMDPTAGPPDCDTITVLVPVGNLTAHPEGKDWEKLKARARQAVMSTFRKQVPGCEEFGDDWIRTEVVNGPWEWRDKFGLWHGAALGLNHHVHQVMYFRPSTRHSEYGNLFFVGASTHPGTGVPIVLCGVEIVYHQITNLLRKNTSLKHARYILGILSYETMVTLLGAVIAVALFMLSRLVLNSVSQDVKVAVLDINNS